jgi:SAM-dependent methyltransferase
MDLREIPRQPASRHPWEIARLAFFRRLLDDAGVLARATSVLDAGAGDGWVTRELVAGAPQLSRAVCWDEAYDAEVVARLGLASTERLEYRAEPPRGRFDLILALDVLEHVEDDDAFLRAVVADHAAPDATVLVSVPAWPSLFGDHDRSMLHFRRYRPAQMRALLRDAGLEVQRAGGLFHSLLLPRLAQNLVARAKNGAARPVSPELGWGRGRLAADLFGAALRLDTAVSRAACALRLELPGLSHWALCRPR